MASKPPSQTLLRLAALAALLLLFVITRGQQDTDATPTFEYSWPDETTTTLLVDLGDDLSSAERDAVLAELPEGLVLNSIWSEAEGLYRVDLPTSQARALQTRLAEDDRIEFVEPEFEYQGSFVPDDPLYQFQWHFDQIHMEQAWDVSRGAGAIVAVIDTGVAYGDDQDHRRVQDLNSFVDGYDFVDDDEFPYDEHGHGTHVAGTVAQVTNNEYGGAGVAPGARIMPLRVLNRWGFGRTADIADAIRWAADNGANIINMSLGGPLPSRIMADAVNYAHEHGVLVIAAAGNHGSRQPHYPAAYEHVLAVAATQADRTTTFYSAMGEVVDIAAPGGNTREGTRGGVLQETIANGEPMQHEFAHYMGTSMASPHVAGVAALLVGQGVTSPERLEEILLSTADQDVPNYEEDLYGAGLLDADAATARASSQFHGSRAILAFFLALLVLLTRRTRETRIGVALMAAVVAAAGLSFVTVPLAAAGIACPTLSALSVSVLEWPAFVGLGFMTHSAIWMSVLPALGLYLVLGGVARGWAQGLVLGAMVGFAAFLFGEAFAPLRDVALMPGRGILDQLWLGLNGTLTLGLVLLASKPRS